MLHTAIGVHRKVKRLTVPERWCFVAGVLALAAESPVRGALLISNKVVAKEEDYAERAGVSQAVAVSTMKKLRELEIVVSVDESGVEVVRDWEEYEPRRQRDPITLPMRLAVAVRYGATPGEVAEIVCAYCPAPILIDWRTDAVRFVEGTDEGATADLDHVHPLARGGPHTVANLVPACRRCNRSKGARPSPRSRG